MGKLQKVGTFSFTVSFLFFDLLPPSERERELSPVLGIYYAVYYFFFSIVVVYTTIILLKGQATYLATTWNQKGHNLLFRE